MGLSPKAAPGTEQYSQILSNPIAQLSKGEKGPIESHSQTERRRNRTSKRSTRYNTVQYRRDATDTELIGTFILTGRLKRLMWKWVFQGHKPSNTHPWTHCPKARLPQAGPQTHRHGDSRRWRPTFCWTHAAEARYCHRPILRSG